MKRFREAAGFALLLAGWLGLLLPVIALHNEALKLWLDFSRPTNRATTLRIAQGLGAMKLGEDSVPIHGG